MRNNDRGTLFLIRGIPGSGKSTMAHKIKHDLNVEHVYIFEADDYFNKTGEYKFDASQLNQAHKTCFNNTSEKLKHPDNVVIVSNTFTTLKELKSYIGLSKHCVIIEMVGNYGSIHGVPPESMDRMRARFVDKTTVLSKHPTVIYKMSNEF